MNVKFKMPKFGRQLTGKGWWKELAYYLTKQDD